MSKKSNDKRKKGKPDKSRRESQKGSKTKTQDHGFEFGSIVWSQAVDGKWFWPCVIIKPDKGNKVKAGHLLVIEFGKNLHKEVAVSGLLGFGEGREQNTEAGPKNPVPETEIEDFLAAVDEAEEAYHNQIAALTGALDDGEPKVDRILGDRKSVDGGEPEYRIKWERRSHLHNSWEKRSDVDSWARIKLRNYRAKKGSFFNDEEEQDTVDGVRAAWVEVERVLAHRGGSKNHADAYLCKWGELAYTEATWEASDLLGAFQAQIDSYWARELVAAKRNASHYEQKSKPKDRKMFKPFEKDPEWLLGGTLHGYQLAGLNWLRGSWYREVQKPL